MGRAADEPRVTARPAAGAVPRHTPRTRIHGSRWSSLAPERHALQRHPSEGRRPGHIKTRARVKELPHAAARSNQPALLHRRSNEARKQRVRLEGARLEFGMELHADEPGMIR